MRIGFLGVIAVEMIFSSSFSSGQQSDSIPDNLYLVKVTTVEVGRREVEGTAVSGPVNLLPSTIPEAKFEISKVYLGPDWLKKRTFTCDLVPYPITVINPLDRLQINVGFEKGVEGLWWVSSNSNGKGRIEPVRSPGVVDPLGIRPFPYQKMKSDGVHNYQNAQEMMQGYQEGLAWAEAVEKVDRAPTKKERGKLLREYASEYNSRAAWAISWLSRSGDQELVPFFQKLVADEKQPIENQVMLDRVLGLLDEKNWMGSKEQGALHKKWRETYRQPILPIALQVWGIERGGRFQGGSGSPFENNGNGLGGLGK
jgi:hypothetical protein